MMTQMRSVWRAAVRLYRCEKGAEGLEKLLIVAAIVLPLLGLLIVFRDRISTWMSETWGQVSRDAGGYQTPNLPGPNN